MKRFELVSDYKPTGDQPEAIDKLVESIESGERYQTLLGVTGSGKTFTMANVIEKVQKKTLVIAHNKTLAGQLCAEFKEFFPNNAVEFFVSYYDYYQPEAYIPGADVFIEKDSSINDEIDKLRHSATLSLFDREDVIVVASVSCIYGLGDPVDYKNMVISLRPGMEKSRESLIEKLVELQNNGSAPSISCTTFINIRCQDELHIRHINLEGHEQLVDMSHGLIYNCLLIIIPFQYMILQYFSSAISIQSSF